jgi:DNA-binding HxlR family transcriptional regulator
MAKRYGQRCPVAKTLELIGDRWTLLVVRDLLPGTRRFQDLLTSLPGLAPNILSDRLKLMEQHGLIARRFYSEHPPRAEYVLTDKGKELGVIVGALAAWGSRHVYRRARLVHAGCDHPVKLGYFCPGCGERVRGADVRMDLVRRKRPRSRAAAASADELRGVTSRS